MIQEREISINTATLGFKFSLEDIIYACADLNIAAISPWMRELDTENKINKVKKALNETGVKLSGICRSEYYTQSGEKYTKAIFDNKHIVDVGEFLDAPCFVQVVGGAASLSGSEKNNLQKAYATVKRGLQEILEYSKTKKIKIALEPLHPMTCADRSCLCSIDQAYDWCTELDPEFKNGLGVAVDAYHVWWDPKLYLSMEKLKDRILALHVSDFLIDTNNLVNDRGLPGNGVIDLNSFVLKGRDLGYTGFIELEVFSSRALGNELTLKECLQICKDSVLRI